MTVHTHRWPMNYIFHQLGMFQATSWPSEVSYIFFHKLRNEVIECLLKLKSNHDLENYFMNIVESSCKKQLHIIGTSYLYLIYSAIDSRNSFASTESSIWQNTSAAMIFFAIIFINGSLSLGLTQSIFFSFATAIPELILLVI
jgi:hypothetical protein